MKKIILTLLLLSSLVGFSQDCEIKMGESGVSEIVKVIETKDTSQSKIYNAVMQSLTDVFKNPESVIEYKSESEGVILGKFIIETYHTGMGPKTHTFKFKLRIDFKPGKYKITTTYISHYVEWTAVSNSCSCPSDLSKDVCGNGLCIMKGEWNKQRCSAISSLNNIIRDIETKTNNVLVVKKDDW
jgi:hypothetical protein